MAAPSKYINFQRGHGIQGPLASRFSYQWFAAIVGRVILEEGLTADTLINYPPINQASDGPHPIFTTIDRHAE